MVMMKVMVTVAMVIVVLMLTLVMMPGGIAPTLIKSAHFVNSLEVERHGPAGKLETNKFRRNHNFLENIWFEFGKCVFVTTKVSEE